jgi:hypothetical protein
MKEAGRAESFALQLIGAWGGSLGADEDGEAAAEMIDLLDELDSTPDDDDPRLTSLFGLIASLHELLQQGYETSAEHQVVLDAFTATMRLLAAELADRGHQVDVPDVRPH